MANVYYRHPQIKEMTSDGLIWLIDFGQSYSLSNVTTFLSSNNYILSAMTDTTNPWAQILHYTLPDEGWSMVMPNDVMCYYIIFSSPLNMEQTNFSFQNIKLYEKDLQRNGYLDTAFFYLGLESMYLNHYIYDPLGNYYFLDYITDLNKTQLVGLFLGIKVNSWTTIVGSEYIYPTIEYEYPYTKFTAADINAAPTNHTHTWADLYGGPLSLAQGGTGRTTLPDNAVIYKNGSQFDSITVSEGVFAKEISTGELSWQPHLPLVSGGTGKTSRDGCTSALIQSYMVPSITPTFSVSLDSTKWVGRLYNAKTGFRVLIPLGGFSWAEGYNITFSGTLRIRQMNAGWSGGSGYLFGSDANTAVPISNISGTSNNFTSSVGVNQFPRLGCVEIYGDSGIAQGKALGMGPIVTEWTILTVNFTAA